MTGTSRVLQRNKPCFLTEPEEEVRDGPLPQVVGPRDPLWVWPVWIDNPHKYAIYVVKLQKDRGLIPKIPHGAFMRFSRLNKDLGWEVLVRAAALATSVARHPFSPKFIKKFLNDVPGKPTSSVRRIF